MWNREANWSSSQEETNSLFWLWASYNFNIYHPVLLIDLICMIFMCAVHCQGVIINIDSLSFPPPSAWSPLSLHGWINILLLLRRRRRWWKLNREFSWWTREDTWPDAYELLRWLLYLDIHDPLVRVYQIQSASDNTIDRSSWGS